MCFLSPYPYPPRPSAPRSESSERLLRQYHKLLNALFRDSVRQTVRVTATFLARPGIQFNRTIFKNCFSISGWIEITQAFLRYKRALACLLLFHKSSNLLLAARRDATPDSKGGILMTKMMLLVLFILAFTPGFAFAQKGATLELEGRYSTYF